MVAHQNGGDFHRIKTLKALDDDISGFPFVGIGNLGGREGAGHRNLAAKVVGVGGAEQRDAARRLGKGDDRPLNNEMDRAIVMASQEAVSLVTWFAEDNPQALIAEIRPDILVKGGDYQMDTLPETTLMHSWGGKALALPFVSGYSTTALVKRIRAQSS